MTLEIPITVAIVAAQIIVVFGFLLVERREPTATMAWLLAVVLLPAAGVVLYLLIGRRRMVRRAHRLEHVRERVKGVLSGNVCNRPARCMVGQADPRTEAFLDLGGAVGSTPATDGNFCEMLVNARTAYPAMADAVLAATDHVHVEFYIFKDDAVGKGLLDVLSRKAREGVEVRVVIDGVGSIGLPSAFWSPLVDAGGKVKTFSPVWVWHRLRRADRVDFRNHRKLVIVDGRVGFTGGINVGREYLGLDPDVGPWRDTHIRLEGPAVLGLQQTFAEDWLWAADELIEAPRYYPDHSKAPGRAVVQIVESGPDRNWAPIHRLYVQAISSARERVWLTNAYFVPDPVMMEALITAALRRVDVRLLLPRRGDSLLMDLASRGHYGPLLAAGVKIHHYRNGFVHAKTLLVDDWVGTVGSANMDTRSFRLNFELNAFVLDADFCKLMARQFEADISDAELVDESAHRSMSHWRRVLHTSARLLSPIL